MKRHLLGTTIFYAPDSGGAAGAASSAAGADGAAEKPAGDSANQASQAESISSEAKAAGESSEAGGDAKKTDTLEAALADAVPDGSSSDPAKPDAESKDGAVTAEGDKSEDAAKTEAKAEEKPDAKADEKAKAKDTDDARLDSHPRFRELQSKVDTLEPEAAEYRKIRLFMDEEGLSAEDVADGLTLSSLLKNDLEKAREVLITLLNGANDTLGYTLSDDLKRAVEDGEITQEWAEKVQRDRAKAKMAGEQAEASSERANKADETARSQKTAGEIRAAVVEWETEQRKNDPDFVRKRTQIGLRVNELLRTRGQPYQSPQDAVAVLQRAKEIADKDVEQWAPPVQERKGVLESQDVVRADTTVTPANAKSLDDALEMAVSHS